MRLEVLRKYYCAKCPIVKRSPRSTGVKLLLSVHKPQRVLDYGCSNWRNSKYLESLGSWSVKVDAFPHTKPDVVAYPTHLPFRNGAFDTVLLTHILMFLEDKTEWRKALEECVRVSRGYVVLETYRVKHEEALLYTPEELLKLLNGLKVVRRNFRRDMQNFVIQI